ncbi:MAG: hypothetical protein ABIE55_00205 [Candidatus Aenigmatarchaeota archaeon]
MVEWIKNLTITFVTTVLVITLSIVYFGLLLWIVKMSSDAFFGPGLDANWAVFAAAIMSAGTVLAGALEKKPSKK